MPRIAKKSGTYHHGDLRRVLLDAAIRVVDKEGVSSLSLHALARKAGVSSGAPYHHFESREQLLAAIASEGYELLKSSLLEAVDTHVAACGAPTARDYLRQLGVGYVRFALKHTGHFRIMFRPELKEHLTEDQRVLVHETFETLGEAIVRGQNEGSVPPGDPKVWILLAWSAVHGASTLWIDGPLAEEQLVTNDASLSLIVAEALVQLFEAKAALDRV